MNRFSTLVALCLLILCVNSVQGAFSSAPNVTLRDAQGKAHSGTLVELTPERIKIQSEELQTFALSSLIAIEFDMPSEPEFPRTSVVLLANGDRIYGAPIAMRDDGLSIRWSAFTAWPLVTIPLETIKGTLINTPAAIGPRSKLEQQDETSQTRQDVVLLQNGDSVQGELKRLTARHITLETTVGENEIDQSGILGLVMNTDLVSFPEVDGLRAILTLTDGSHLTVTDLLLGPDGLVECQAAFGEQLTVPIQAIQEIRLLGGCAEYLSDLTEQNYQFTPFLSLQWPLRKDRNVLARPLRLQDRDYVKGLGMHSAAQVTYSLDGRYDLFLTTIGIDAQTEGRGSVVFRISVDDQLVYSSPEVTGKSDPITIPPIDLKGKQKLTLHVDFGNFGDIQDHANWCNPILILTEPESIPAESSSGSAR